jgi:uncharacterized protein
VNPFFFGSSKSPLYGVYHPPKSAVGPATAVLLCYPMGAEYMRCHRAFRQLTTLLVKGGAHVLRFDYFGTGDSAGDATEATFARWREDISTAIEELREMCQAERVTVVGLRFGATLAAQAVAGRPDVEHLVLWDPIIDGPAYVREMLVTHAAEQAARGRGAGDGTAGVHGFPLLKSQRDELNAMTLPTWPSSAARRVDVVRSSPSDEAEALATRLMAEGSAASYSVYPSNGNWAESDAFGSALIPQGIIQGIIGKVLESGVTA